MKSPKISKIRKTNFQKSGISGQRCPIGSADAAVDEEVFILKTRLGQRVAGLPDLQILGNFADGVHAELSADLDDPALFLVG